MFEDISMIGWLPALAGMAVLIVGAIAGWGMAVQPGFFPARLVQFWVERVIFPALRQPSWLLRSAVVFVNNGTVCSLVVLAGSVPGGAWAAIVLVGLAMGIAVRTLSMSDIIGSDTETGDLPTTDLLVQIGLVLNLLELPAIVITLGLSMGQLASPNGLSEEQIWGVFLYWVVPLLAVSASGESLWIGRQRPIT